jgi:hypothetical protein
VPEEPSTCCQAWGENAARPSSSSAPGFGRQPAVGEKAHRQADAADREGLGRERLAGAAEDHLGRTAADIDHQARLLARLQVRHAAKNQACFLAARDHLDRMAQHRLCAGQESIAVARLAQGLGRHGAHLGRRKALQALGKAAQAGQAALGRFLGQLPVGVEAGAQAHGLLDVVDALIAPARQARDLEAETVGADIDPRQWRIGAWQALGVHGRIVLA